MNKKIAVVGAGNVGATCAMYLAEANFADVVMVDIIDGVPQGKGLDLSQAGPVRGVVGGRPVPFGCHGDLVFSFIQPCGDFYDDLGRPRLDCLSFDPIDLHFEALQIGQC